MIAALGVVALVGARRRLPMTLVAAGGGLMVVGVLGIFSIGVPLLAAGAMALWAAIASRGSESVPGILLRFLAWLVGFAVVTLSGLSLT